MVTEKVSRARSRKKALSGVGRWFSRNNIPYSMSDKFELAKKVAKLDEEVEFITGSTYRGAHISKLVITDWLRKYNISSVVPTSSRDYSFYRYKDFLSDREKKHIYKVDSLQLNERT